MDFCLSARQHVAGRHESDRAVQAHRIVQPRELRPITKDFGEYYIGGTRCMG
jgi:hypothetical protein